MSDESGMCCVKIAYLVLWSGPHGLICEFSGYKFVMNQPVFVIVVSFFAKIGEPERDFPAPWTAGDKKMIDKIGSVTYNIVSRYMCATPGAGV